VSVFERIEAGAAAPSDPGERPERRHLSERQAEVMERLVSAAVAEAEERPYGEISVRSIAKRAGVAPATAYTYFSGKDHLLALVLWRAVESSPQLVDLALPAPERVAELVRTMGFAALGPGAVAAGTTALLTDGPDARRVRAHLGEEIDRRLAAALGAEVNSVVRGILVLTYTGALISAGMGHLPFEAVPALMAQATELMTRSNR
jgi:AcrR family transcriptional regulator